MTRYQGDDLINLIRVSISAESGELPEIEEVDLKVGPLCLKYYHPANPFNVNIMRNKSIRLSTVNQVYACIWYWTDVEGKRTLVKKTCEGTLTLQTKPELINGGCGC